MSWKRNLGLFLFFLIVPPGHAACAGSAIEQKSQKLPDVKIESQESFTTSSATLAETEQETTQMPTETPQAIEENFQELIAANISESQSTDYDLPGGLSNFAGVVARDCKCGRQGEPAELPFSPFKSRALGLSVAPFIVNGTDAGEHEFKWMVGIAKKRAYDPPGSAARLICGATVINSKYLLTAAHCIQNVKPENYYLLFKTHNLKNVFKSNSTGLIAKAKRFIPHPRWDIETVAHDIGLIELEEPIDFAKEPNIRPACLPTLTDGDFTGQEATVIGWGYTEPKRAMATVLQKVNVPVMSHNDCVKTRYSTMVTPSMVCAGYPEGKKDACTNDSGGPLTVSTAAGYHKLIGVVSWGHGCAQENAPGVYTRVTKYVNWIRSVVRGAEWCTPY